MSVTVETELLRTGLERITLLIKERSQADEIVGKVSFKKNRFWCKTEDTRASMEVDFLKGLPDFCIEGMDLFRYLQRLSEPSVTLEKEDDTLVVKGKKTKAKFACFEPFEFPLPDKWHNIGPAFLETLAETSRFVAKSYFRPVLTAVCVKDNMMQATDAMLFFRTFGKEKFMRKEETLIPGASVPFIQLLAPDQYYIDDNIMYFKQKPTLIGACSLLGGDYPSTTNMENQQKQGQKISFHPSTKEAVSRCSVFVENSRFEEEKKIFVTLAKGKAALSVKASIGSNKEQVLAKYPAELEGTLFCLRPDFFTEVLKKGTEFLLCPKSIQIKNDTLWVASAVISRS